MTNLICRCDAHCPVVENISHLSTYMPDMSSVDRPYVMSWWRHQMETFSALLAICAGNSPVPGEFPTQRPVTRSFDVFFDLRLNKRLSKQPWGWWFETLSRPLWRHRNGWINRWWPFFHSIAWTCWLYCLQVILVGIGFTKHVALWHVCHELSPHCVSW